MTLTFFGNRQLAARAFVDANAAGMTEGYEKVFASKIRSPGCYIDCRKLPAHPEQWRVIISEVVLNLSVKRRKLLGIESVASVEAGGIPHASVFAWEAGVPSVWVRKKPKAYGNEGMIAGDLAAIEGKGVGLIEDMGTTGESSETAVTALRRAGAKVEHVILLTTYGFPDLVATAESLGVTFHALCSFEDILKQMVELGRVRPEYEALIRAWLKDPWADWIWPD